MIKAFIKQNIFLKAIILVCTYYIFLNGLVYLLVNIIDIEFFDSDNKAQVIELAPLLLVLVLIFLIFKKRIKHGLTSSIKNDYFIKGLFFVIVFCVLVRVLNDPIYRIREIFGDLKFPSLKDYTSVPIKDQIVLLIKVLIVAPILEEFLFRGIILKIFMDKRTNVYLSLFVSSILFSLIHFNPLLINYSTILSAFVLGIFSGLIYIRFNLLHSILFHVFYNLIWFLLRRNRDVYRNLINELNYNTIYWIIILISFLLLIFLSKKIVYGYSRGLDK